MDRVKGYEYGPGRHAIAQLDELDQLRPVQDKALRLEHFLAPAQLDPLLFAGRSLYLVPDGPVSEPGYGVLRTKSSPDDSATNSRPQSSKQANMGKTTPTTTPSRRLSSQLGKVMLYDRCADALRNGEVVLHAFATHAQLASIDGSTLRAPEGEHDDRADAFALACAGRTDAGSVWVESPFDRNAVGMMHPANVPVGVFMSMDEELGRGLWGPGGSLGRPW